MVNTFFISDTHWGHNNILTFKRADGNPLRVFNSIEDHDEYIIEQWNKTVRPQDHIYHLGDVAINRKSIGSLTSSMEKFCDTLETLDPTQKEEIFVILKRLFGNLFDEINPTIDRELLKKNVSKKYIDKDDKFLAFFNDVTLNLVKTHPLKIEKNRILPILSRLNGHKRLVRGNHDIFKTADYLQYFEEIYGVRVIDKIIFSHIPIHEDSLGRFRACCHGHLHSNLVMKDGQIDTRYINVSCEQLDNYTPISLEELNKRIPVSEDDFRKSLKDNKDVE